MEKLASPAWLTARGRRALVLITLSLAGMLAAALMYLWPALAPRSPNAPLTLPGKGSLNSITFFDRNEGWAVLAGPLASSAPSSIVRTSDGGRHWRLADVPDASSYSLIRFFDARRAMVSVNTPLGQILYTTDNGGIDWKSFDLPGHRNDGFASFVFLDPRRGWYLEGTPPNAGRPAPADVQQGFVLWRTQDGGGSWSELMTVDAAHPQAGLLSLAGFRGAMSFSDDLHGALVSVPAATFYVTQDGGVSWKAMPLPSFPYTLIGGDGSGASVRMLRFQDLLVEMVRISTPGSDLPRVDVFSRVSEDGGSTWSTLRPLPDNPGPGALPFFQDSRHWMLGQGRSIWRTSDAGQDWEFGVADVPGSLGISDLQVVGDGVVWAVAPNGSAPDRILLSRDGGAHWEDRGAPSLQVVR
jgi:photosystem II stability/assembly factor-like uncharacterized protein